MPDKIPHAEEGLLPWEDIADILDVSVETVKRRYSRAIRRLRTAMMSEGISAQEFEHYLKLRFGDD